MIIDHCRDIEEFKRLYDSRPLDDGLYSFEHILNNPHLYCLYDEITGVLKAYIFINADENNNLFLSGASVRKNLPDNINAIIKVCNAYPCDMYAETDKRTADVVLRKAGFKKIDTNLYKRVKNG